MRRRTLWGRVVAALAALGVAVALAACNPSPEPTEPAGPPTEVTYLSNFGTFGRDGYAWMAQERGHFADANLEVTIQPGSGTVGNMAALISGQAQFAAIDMAGLAVVQGQEYGGDDPEIAEQLDGRPLEGVVAIAAIHQLPLGTIMSYADSGIERPEDLAGRTIGLPAGASTGLLFPTYAELAMGADAAATVEIVELAPPQLVPALASDEVDGIGQFAPGAPLVEAAGGGRQVHVLSYSEYLDDLYGVGLFTTVEMAREQPELVVQFRDALLLGLQDSMDDPAAMGAALATAVPEADPAVAAAEMELMTPYSRVTGAVLPLGHIDEARLMRHIALLQSVGLLGFNSGMTPQDLVDFSLVPAGAR